MSKMFAALHFDYIQECFTRRILSHYNVDMLVIGRSDSRHQANGNSGMKSHSAVNSFPKNTNNKTGQVLLIK